MPYVSVLHPPHGLNNARRDDATDLVVGHLYILEDARTALVRAQTVELPTPACLRLRPRVCVVAAMRCTVARSIATPRRVIVHVHPVGVATPLIHFVHPVGVVPKWSTDSLALSLPLSLVSRSPFPPLSGLGSVRAVDAACTHLQHGCGCATGANKTRQNPAKSRSIYQSFASKWLRTPSDTTPGDCCVEHQPM